MIVPPLAVCAGETVPHVKPPPAQVTYQSIPAFAGSLASVAVTGTVVATFIEAGAAWEMLTVISGVCVFVCFAEPDEQPETAASTKAHRIRTSVLCPG